MILPLGNNAASVLAGLVLATQLVSANPSPSFKRVHLKRDDVARANLNKRSGPVSFPIHRRTFQKIDKREIGSTTPEELLMKREAAIAKIVRRYYPSRLNKHKRSVQTIPMSSFQEDNLYYATVLIGTPVQALDVQVCSTLPYQHITHALPISSIPVVVTCGFPPLHARAATCPKYNPFSTIPRPRSCTTDHRRTPPRHNRPR